MSTRVKVELVKVVCVDCGGPSEWQSQQAIDKGSTIRDPGEAVCIPCTSRRNLLVRQLKTIPDSLALIKAKRMVRR